MHTGLLHTHSLLRYFVLIMLVVVVVIALQKWLGKKPYSGLDNKLGLYLFIFTHLQLLIGLILYVVSPVVQFNAGTMKNAELRYWAVEHISLNIIAIVLITLARTTSKKMAEDSAKHKRMFLFNGLALLLIIVSLSMSGRGIIHQSLF
ncbi:MAG: cytochrome B [Cyclobacteriaceae bacterium]|nr:cytochrome B [Cyclobacteriaceae bacterium]MBX2956640.1 cytochrome B [Cyclobacteriaceae bacterium]